MTRVWSHTHLSTHVSTMLRVQIIAHTNHKLTFFLMVFEK